MGQAREKSPIAFALVLVVCTVGARLPSMINDPLWQDEVGTERVIAQPTARDAIARIVHRESTLPAFYLAVWAFDHIESDGAHKANHVRALRVLPLLFSVATTFLTFFLAADLLPLGGAAVAGVLVAFSSELVIHGSELRAYSLLALVSVAFAITVRRAAKSPRPMRLGALTVVVAVGSLTHYFFLLTVASGLLWLLSETGLRHRAALAVLAGLIPLAAWSPSWLRQYRNGTYGTSPRFAVGRVQEVVSGLFVPQPILARLTGATSLLILVLVIGSAITLLRTRGEPRLIGILTMLPLASGSAVAALGPRVFNTRNLIGVTPFASIALAFACTSISSTWFRRVIAITAAASIVATWSVSRAKLGRTPYDVIARSLVSQGFRRTEPIVWFGGFGRFVSVEWYAAAEAANVPKLTTQIHPDRECRAFSVVAAGPAGRAWLDRYRAAVLAQASFPSYGDVPQGRRDRNDTVVVRMRWTPHVLANAAASHALVLRPGGHPSPCTPGAATGADAGLRAAQPTQVARTRGTLAYDTHLAGNNTVEIVADGQNARVVTAPRAGGRDPAWSPNGLQIAFVSRRYGNDDIYVMDPDGGHQRRLTHGEDGDSQPAWSPDGRLIAFNRQRQNGRNQIWVMSPAGRRQRPLTPLIEDDAHPAWSPDSTQIAFDTIRTGRAAVFALGLESLRERPLTDSGDAFPTWSPDGQTIAFESTRDGNGEIYLKQIDGHHLKRLTRDQSGESRPAWSPDGRAIAYSRTTGPGLSQIVVTTVDGHAERRLTDASSRSDDPTWKGLPQLPFHGARSDRPRRSR